MKSIELLYSLCKEIGVGPPGLPFYKIFIVHPRKKKLNQNDVEFDLSIGHALVPFLFFPLINKKCMVDHVHPPRSVMYPGYPPKFIYINIFLT